MPRSELSCGQKGHTIYQMASNPMNKLLGRRVDKVLPSKEGLATLLNKKKIRLYQGFDPTGSKLHLGHSIGLRKLMDFANAGHEVIFLFGTGTVLVGDPSQRETGRKLITQKEIDENIKDWKKQAEKIVDFSKVKIMQNGDWLTKLNLKDIVQIASKISAIQLFKRESFQRRIDRGDTVWYHETMYPLLQGYDSVAMDVDLEIGGSDQEFNMLIGRELQHKINNREKYVLTLPMILGTDGKQMSKTSGNCIWLEDTANDIYSKLMGVLDTQIVPYMKLVTDIPMERVEEVNKLLRESKLHPLDAKKELAMAVVTQLHSEKAAKEANDYFEKTFQEKNPEYSLKIINGDNLTETVVAASRVSKSEAKRLISYGSVTIEGQVITDPTYKPKIGQQIQIGKRTFGTIVDSE